MMWFLFFFPSSLGCVVRVSPFFQLHSRRFCFRNLGMNHNEISIHQSIETRCVCCLVDVILFH